MHLKTKHPITITIEEITDVFKSMGFSICEGPEIETVYNNFDALNADKNHPARAMTDTFYLTEEYLLRTQTSPVQIRTIKKQKPPIKIISPGRCFRCDTADATHSPMFHQVEGLVIDEGITMADLKGTLNRFAKLMFGESAKTKLRPHHFPFTEPSAEVDLSCFKCNGEEAFKLELFRSIVSRKGRMADNWPDAEARAPHPARRRYPGISRYDCPKSAHRFQLGAVLGRSPPKVPGHARHSPY